MKFPIKKTIALAIVLATTIALVGGAKIYSVDALRKPLGATDAVIDAAPPITSVHPAENETKVKLIARVYVTFSANMDACSFTDVFTLTPAGGSPVAGIGVYNSRAKTYVFTPSAMLYNQTVYTANFDMHQGGKCEASKTWSFETAKILEYTVPADGDIDVDQDATIQAYYSFDVTQCQNIEMTVLQGGVPVSGTFTTYSSPVFYSEFVPSVPFHDSAVIEVFLSISSGKCTYCNYQTSWSFTIEGPTAVFLLYFNGTPYPSNDGVFLDWETAMELDNAGFNLYRSESLDDPWVKLNQYLIPSCGPGQWMGCYYTWDDVNGIIAGTTYYYMLEDMDFSGYKTQHDPIEVYVGE